ncbi:MAG: hypothetical protein RIF32_04425, partial [Leptospirales bacterium]|jgi:hypothetical protein
MRTIIFGVLALTLLHCAGPAKYVVIPKYVGTPPEAPEEKLLVHLGDPALYLTELNGKSHGRVYGALYVEPGPHRAVFAYDSGYYVSNGSLSLAFEGIAEQVILVCSAPIYQPAGQHEFSWHIFMLVAPRAAGYSPTLTANTNTTCLFWKNMLVGNVSAMRYNLKNSPSKLFRDANGDTIVEAARRNNASPGVVKVLVANGFE